MDDEQALKRKSSKIKVNLNDVNLMQNKTFNIGFLERLSILNIAIYLVC